MIFTTCKALGRKRGKNKKAHQKHSNDKNSKELIIFCKLLIDFA
jgi:hypothetical protein